MGQIQFSNRERQVIQLLIQGKSNKEIALALDVSVRAVEFHLSNIYSKLGVSSRTEAALKLSELQLRESTGGELRESTVPERDESDDNIETSISTRRIPVNKSFLIGLGILIATSVSCVGSIYQMAERSSNQSQAMIVIDATDGQGDLLSGHCQVVTEGVIGWDLSPVGIASLTFRQMNMDTRF